MKLALDVMEQIIKKATAKEIDFLLFIMRFQDNMGIVKGITKSEVCSALKIHKSKFYDIMVKLEQKGLVRVFWNEKRHGFWTMSVIGNSFVEKSDYKRGYINLNTVFLWTDKFLNLTKSEKVICLKILALYRDCRQIMPLKFETLMNWTGMSLQSVKKYANSIKDVFKSVSIEAGLIIIDLKECFWMFGRNMKSENETHNEHLLDYIVKAKKISSPTQEEITGTLKIFKILGGKHGINAVVTAIIKCLENNNKLIPKYINKLTQIIGKNKNMIELFY